MKKILIYGSDILIREDLLKVERILETLNVKENLILTKKNNGCGIIVKTFASILRFKYEIFFLDEEKYGKYAEMKMDLDILFSGIHTIYVLNTNIKYDDKNDDFLHRAKTLNIRIIYV